MFSLARVAWSYLDKNSAQTTYGLLLAKTTFDGDTRTTRYDSDDCNIKNDVCQICHDTGSAVISFLVFAMIGVFILAFWIVMRIRLSPAMNPVTKRTGYIITGVTTFCFFITWVSWSGECNRLLQDEVDNDVQLSSGFALAFLCFLMTPIVAMRASWRSQMANCQRCAWRAKRRVR